MADPNTRQGKRTPVTLKIKFKSETLEQFIERYAVDVSQGGIFIRTKEPLAVGTQMKFEFQLRDASPLIAGEGTVVWTRENDPSRPAIAPGMGVRFDKLAEGSQAVLEKILAEKQKQAPSRGGNEATTKPPMFTDTPTKVAPAPIVQEALGGRPGGRRREDSEQTPLPKPMPFHSDAEVFDERAFEEATKVRSLDELAAQSALSGDGGDQVSDEAQTAQKTMPADELAARRQPGRADSTLADPLADPPVAEPQPPVERNENRFGRTNEPDRESAPGLPSPPETARPRMLDTTPRTTQPSVPPVNEQRTKLGMEPAKAPTGARASASSSLNEAVPRAIANEPSRPVAPKRPSSTPIVLGILLVVVGGLAALWVFFLKAEVMGTDTDNDNPDKGGSAVVIKTSGSTGSAGSAVATGSDKGSAVATTGSDTGSAVGVVATGSDTGSAGPTMAGSAGGKPVDTVIASSVTKGAVVEIQGTDMKGPAPFTAKLEKDRMYKARVSAPGFVAQEVDVKGGGEKVVAKLAPKAKVISVTTEPAGADILVDGVSTSKLSPSEVTLTAAQAARPRVRITLRRPGYKASDQLVDAAKFTDGDAQMTASVDVKLVVAPKIVPGGGGNNTNNNTGGSGATTGSGATPTGTGSGSAATPTGGGTTPTGGGTGSGTTPPAGGTTTPPAGGTSSTTTPPSGGAAGSASGQALK